LGKFPVILFNNFSAIFAGFYATKVQKTVEIYKLFNIYFIDCKINELIIRIDYLIAVAQSATLLAHIGVRLGVRAGRSPTELSSQN
jgi:hypothetical protein